MASRTLGRASLIAQKIEGRFIYCPDRPIPQTPKDAGLTFEDVWFTASDGVRLHAWFVPGTVAPAVLWFHGNAGNIGNRVGNLAAIKQHRDVPVLMLDYRGYGRSLGVPTEWGLYRDAEASLEAYRRIVGQEAPIVYLGQSLGSAVATDLAARAAPAGLILESAFTSVPEMSKLTHPRLPVSFLLQTKFDSITKIAGVEAPTLIVHGHRDDLVPISMARRLHARSTGRTRLLELEKSGHCDFYVTEPTGYFEAVTAFLEEDVAQLQR